MSLKNWWPFRRKSKNKAKVDDSFDVNQRLYMPVAQLRVGMYVVELDRPWLESPFLFQGFELESEDDIRAVQEVCNHVYIDATRKRRRPAPIKSRQDSLLTDSNIDFSAPPPPNSASLK